MSADIFGLTVLSKGDMGIGQTIRAIADNCDYISPMVYPSHYHLGEYGIPNPDKEPYKIVFVSLRISKVHDQPITLILRYMPVKSVHDLST